MIYCMSDTASCWAEMGILEPVTARSKGPVTERTAKFVLYGVFRYFRPILSSTTYVFRKIETYGHVVAGPATQWTRVLIGRTVVQSSWGGFRNSYEKYPEFFPSPQICIVMTTTKIPKVQMATLTLSAQKNLPLINQQLLINYLKLKRHQKYRHQLLINYLKLKLHQIYKQLLINYFKFKWHQIKRKLHQIMGTFWGEVSCTKQN